MLPEIVTRTYPKFVANARARLSRHFQVCYERARSRWMVIREDMMETLASHVKYPAPKKQPSKSTKEAAAEKVNNFSPGADVTVDKPETHCCAF